MYMHSREHQQLQTQKASTKAQDNVTEEEILSASEFQFISF